MKKYKIVEINGNEKYKWDREEEEENSVEKPGITKHSIDSSIGRHLSQWAASFHIGTKRKQFDFFSYELKS